MAHQIEAKRQRKIGWIFLTAWGVLIVAGIVAKRIFDHGDWMVFFHLPAAVCLVVSFQKLSYEFRQKYRHSLLQRAQQQRPFTQI